MSPVSYRRQQHVRAAHLLMVIPVVIIFALWQQVTATQLPKLPDDLPTLPAKLTNRDVLPTLTAQPGVPLRQIIFPGATLVTDIVPAFRNGANWETRYLGDSVGHLEGTSWLDDPGGNIVLIGHVEDAQGHPGPFASLLKAQAGDIVMLRDGERLVSYRVSSIDKADPNDLRYVAQDGQRRITLITCADWDVKTSAYLSRLIAIARPVGP